MYVGPVGHERNQCCTEDAVSCLLEGFKHVFLSNEGFKHVFLSQRPDTTVVNEVL